MLTTADEYYYLPYNMKSQLTVVKWFTLSDTTDKSQDLNPRLSSSRVCICSHLHTLIPLILRSPFISSVYIIQISSAVSRQL